MAEGCPALYKESMAGTTVEHVAAAGVVGAGGAGFPTHVKLNAQVDTVIINAAECEPLLHKDKEVLRDYADQVLSGLATAMRLMRADRGIVAVKEKHQDVIELLQPKLTPKMSTVPLRDVYPAGDEFILTYDVTGRVIPPGGLPLDVGVVSLNVETALNISTAAERPVTEKYLTVGGAVANPTTLRVPVGTSLAECVAAAGGSTADNANYMVGGIMMGRLADDPNTPVDKTTGGIIVLSNDHVVIRRRRQQFKQIARIGRSACDQCSFCTELCPRYLLGHPIEPHRTMRSLGFNLIGEANVLGTAYCCECNLCSLYACPEDLDPKNICTQNKHRLAEEHRKWQSPPFNPTRPSLHLEARKAPMSRLMEKLGLRGFLNAGPLNQTLLQTRKVGIALKQHIGSPCEPTVQVGAKVSVGDVVGRPPASNGKVALGAPVHASIDGTVTVIENGLIWIEKQ